MATAKWATPGTISANLAGTTLDSLASGSTSAFVTYDNSTNLDLYGSVRIALGSLTPAAGGSITLRVYSAQGANVPDDPAAISIGGDTYTVPLTTTASAKVAVIPMIRLYPESMRLQVTNNAGVALAATGNSIFVRPFNESIA